MITFTEEHDPDFEEVINRLTQPLHLQDRTVALMNFLHGFANIMIAGGYPRDLYHDVRPKDLDIAVTGCRNGGQLSDSLNKLIDYAQGSNMLDHVFLTGEHADYDMPEVFAVVKLTNSIDVIFWEPRVSSHFVLQHGFDYNINQFVMIEDEPVFMGNPKFKGVLLPINDDMTEYRTLRMQEKARQLDWEVPGTRVTKRLLELAAKPF